MIVVALLALADLVLQGIIAVLPNLTTPYASTMDDFAVEVGGKFHALDAFIPISEWATAMAWVAGVYMPVRYTWIMGQWLWARLPFVN